MRRNIFRCSSGFLERVGLVIWVSLGSEKTGGAVPPAGALMRRRSACIVMRINLLFVLAFVKQVDVGSRVNDRRHLTVHGGVGAAITRPFQAATLNVQQHPLPSGILELLSPHPQTNRDDLFTQHTHSHSSRPCAEATSSWASSRSCSRRSQSGSSVAFAALTV